MSERADELKENDVKQVWKYELAWTDTVELVLPQGAEPLSVGLQSDKLVLWALVDPAAPKQGPPYRFRIAGTGHSIKEEVSNGDEFLGTVQTRLGLVFHVWAIP